MDLISRERAIDAVKHAWAKGLEPSQYIEIIPSVPAVPLDKLAAMLSTIGADINCYYCREVLGECTKPPEKREYECDSMAHWAAFLNGWMQRMEEQDADNI